VSKEWIVMPGFGDRMARISNSGSDLSQDFAGFDEGFFFFGEAEA
jgi:hypothetical protein